MYRFTISRPQFHGPHPMTFSEVGGYREVDVFIGRGAFDYVVLSNVENNIGLTNAPAVDVRRYGRHVARIAFFCPLIDPLNNRPSLRFTQTRIIGEVAG